MTESAISDQEKLEQEKKAVQEKRRKDLERLGIKLKNFYQNYFKVDTIFEVIERKNFETREFGFDRLDQGFTRNKSFESPNDLKEYLGTFPIGGAYIGSLYQDRLLPGNNKVKAITIHNSRWLGRELIYDFDMDEYDPVRKCDCQGKMVCNDCWYLMQEASVIITDTLKEDFGFRDLRWVYTGGRGYHCWVLDKQAFTLDQDQRSAIIGYMQLIHDPKGLQKIDSVGEHAELLKRRIYSRLGKYFVLQEYNNNLLKELKIKKKDIDFAREFLPTTNIETEIISFFNSIIPKESEDNFMLEVIKNLYPRIDHKVTIDIRRLIRMPGSIHGRNHNLCEFVDDPFNFNPIKDAKKLDQFV